MLVLAAHPDSRVSPMRTSERRVGAWSALVERGECGRGWATLCDSDEFHYYET
jgi:hypothetical protein